MKLELDQDKVERIDQKREEHYQEREEVASEELRPLINSFLEGETSLSRFRSSVDGLNKSNDHWGFNGFAGMMFFNKLAKCEGSAEIIRETIPIPSGMKEAREKIDSLVDYIEERRNKADNISSMPSPKSSVFFLSYFWNIQDPARYPIFQKSSRNLLEERTDYSDDRGNFSDLYQDSLSRLDELIDEYNIQEDRKYDRINGVLYRVNMEEQEQEEQEAEEIVEETKDGYDEYIPPKVADFPEIARGSQKAEKDYDIDLSVLTETKANKIFEMMGYETKQLGQGSGRDPDGIAYSIGSYAIVWDTKKRENENYKVDTSDERKIRDYTEKYSRVFDKLNIERVYFLTISSGFSDTEYNRELDQKSKVRNINFITAETLTQLLGLTIKNPEVKIEDIEKLFRDSSIIEKEQLPQVIPEASADDLL